MGMVPIIGVALLAAVLLVLLRQAKPELAVPAGIAAGVVLFLLAMQQIGAVLDLVVGLLERAQLAGRFVTTLLQMIGIAYLTEFGAQICRDAGEHALGGKVELIGKLFILVLAVPILIAVLETLLDVLPA